MVAAAKGNLEVASLLISHGADPQTKAADNSTAADWATRFGHTEIADFLNDHSAVSLLNFIVIPRVYQLTIISGQLILDLSTSCFDDSTICFCSAFYQP